MSEKMKLPETGKKAAGAEDARRLTIFTSAEEKLAGTSTCTDIGEGLNTGEG